MYWGDVVNGFIKFIIGAIVTSLMAMADHSWLAGGNRFLDGLQGKARAAVGNAGAGSGVTVEMQREPSLARIAVLSGTADPAMRAKIEAAVLAIPGIASVRWVEAATPPAEAPATAEQVQNCQTQVDAAIAGKTIQFETGSAAIHPDSQPLIDNIAKVLTPCSGVTVEVAGHTDATGNPASNQTLSRDRAQAVITALTAKGVPAMRLVANGYGSSQPRVPGRGAAADAANRRIEFKVTSSGGTAAAATTAAATPAATAASTQAGGN